MKFTRSKKREMKKQEGKLNQHMCEPFRSFRRRCRKMVKEHRTRFYILRRCVTMLVCWTE
ncbi:hypothetical protein AHAS_Ahas20G0076500 [Arachis hypogaea]|uniref:DVL protein n=2 Tax=Arachis hypogaea TaxID=3818 RepID=A0A444WZ45_ARAHY|nr:hypothetical protein Ahy_B10g101264 [Arachis hypogaea]